MCPTKERYLFPYMVYICLNSHHPSSQKWRAKRSPNQYQVFCWAPLFFPMCIYVCIYIYVYIHIYIMTTVLSELMFPPPSQMQRVRCWPWSRAKRGENFDCPRRHLRRRRCNEQAAILAQEWGGRSR